MICVRLADAYALIDRGHGDLLRKVSGQSVRIFGLRLASGGPGNCWKNLPIEKGGRPAKTVAVTSKVVDIILVDLNTEVAADVFVSSLHRM